MNFGRRLAIAVSAALVASLPGGAAVAGSGQSDLAEVRRATAKYHNVEAAIAAGYTPAPVCVPGMGYHYVNFDLFGAPLDPLKPAGLLYAPRGDGEVRLVGVEYFVVDADQDTATHNDEVPSLFGQDFDGPMPGHEPGMPVHYDLHAYLWQANPAGVLSTWNSNIRCD